MKKLGFLCIVWIFLFIGCGESPKVKQYDGYAKASYLGGGKYQFETTAYLTIKHIYEDSEIVIKDLNVTIDDKEYLGSFEDEDEKHFYVYEWVYKQKAKYEFTFTINMPPIQEDKVATIKYKTYVDGVESSQEPIKCTIKY